ncbi:putative protein CHUP1, chloroplastic-like [Capsicum annuum]|uniref:uncharacterized protein LOC107848085 n=1 Tax=Capsicum annuum TaxID=4072 RepID=UPI0007BFC723|nr:uncharacterized protein LOC107848085 [Capsicum annuum]KAF3662570.1 putative protein CHUP1, chloroplastic-like [Capsicum annuum]KAF3672016.1 putative protein CHUP1, chloroplastic-like [Capsicum annuum]
MCSSITPFPLTFPPKYPLINNQDSIFTSHPFILKTRIPKFTLSASVSEKVEEVSWGVSDPNNAEFDVYNGWDFVQPPVFNKKKKGLSKFLVIGMSVSLAAGLGVASYFSLYQKGFKFQFTEPFHGSHVSLVPNEASNKGENGETADLSTESDQISEMVEGVPDFDDKNVVSETRPVTTKAVTSGVLGRITIPFAVDSTQEEALFVLKKLEIIEDDVKADELCTRREYARWLVKTNTQLERSRKHRIVPSVVLSGSTIAAFDDVSVDDPDFATIQSLAEAGIIPSKLSDREFASTSNVSEDQGVCFLPDRFLSRQDLISWKAKIEYEVMPGIDKEISRKNIGFLDVRDINSEALVELFVDLRAGEQSILRRVFGQAKRFQPDKPSTKAQAAVSLTSGRMEEYIQSELSKLEAENLSRLMEMEEIKSDLLDRGEIQRIWESKMEAERSRGLEVESDYLASVRDLEQEKIVQENARAELLRQKAALDCQKQLLSSLKEEVDEMSERLAREKFEHVNEQCDLSGTIHDLQVKHEAVLDTKSMLEAEIEALRKLRSWVEDEARRSQARAKVLEEVERRWKWEDQ